MSLTTGTRIIFAADTGLQVRNKIYEVEFISPDTVAPLISQPVIHLVVVDTKDAVLVCAKDKVQEVKRLMKVLPTEVL